MQLNRAAVVFLGILALIATGFVLYVTKAVFLPLVIALMLSIVLAPIVRRLTIIKVPRIVAIAIVILLIFGLLYLAGLFIYSSIQSLVNIFPKYQDKLYDLIRLYEDYQRELIINLGPQPQEGEGINIPSIIGEEPASNGLPPKASKPPGIFSDFNWPATIRGTLLNVSGSFVGFLATIGVIVFFLVFMLMEIPYFSRKIKQAYPRKLTDRLDNIFSDILNQVARYLSIKILVSFITGLATFILTSSVGMDFPLIWGSIAFLFNFIPNLGSFLVNLIIILFGVLQFFPDRWGSIIVVVIGMTAIQNGLGGFAEPKLQGESLNLSPLIILVSLLFWGWLWGIGGMILAVPLTVTMKIVFNHVSFLKPIDVLMGTGKDYRSKNPGIKSLFQGKKSKSVEQEAE